MISISNIAAIRRCIGIDEIDPEKISDTLRSLLLARVSRGRQREREREREEALPIMLSHNRVRAVAFFAQPRGQAGSIRREQVDPTHPEQSMSFTV